MYGTVLFIGKTEERKKIFFLLFNMPKARSYIYLEPYCHANLVSDFMYHGFCGSMYHIQAHMKGNHYNFLIWFPEIKWFRFDLNIKFCDVVATINKRINKSYANRIRIYMLFFRSYSFVSGHITLIADYWFILNTL